MAETSTAWESNYPPIWFNCTLQEFSFRNSQYQAHSVQFSSVAQSCPTATQWIAAHQASLSITGAQSLLKPMSNKSVMPSSHLILCRPLLCLPPIPPSIRVFSNESTLHMRWPKYWSFSFSISPSNEHQGLISFRTDWLDLLAVQGTLKSLLQTTLSSFMAMPTAVSWLVSCVEMWTFKQKASFSTSGLSRTATLAFQAAPCWEELACMAILMWQLEAGHWQLSLVSHEFILDLTNCFKNAPSHKS